MKKTTRCRQCGVELPRLWSTDICLECSTKNVKAIFKEFPDVKKAFYESIDKMKKQLKEVADWELKKEDLDMQRKAYRLIVERLSEENER